MLEAETNLRPLPLLARLHDVEQLLKRQREIPNGPRTLDIDLLFYGDKTIHATELQVPHPRFRQRRFVLQPLADLSPNLRDPVTQRTVESLLRDVSQQALRRTEIIISATRLS